MKFTVLWKSGRKDIVAYQLYWLFIVLSFLLFSVFTKSMKLIYLKHLFDLIVLYKEVYW